MQKSLITMTITVEAILPNSLSVTEFVKRFPQNIHDHDVEIVEKKFESQQYLERDP